MVLRGSLAVTAAGVLLGLPLAMAGAWLMRSLLIGVRPSDPRILAAGAQGILLVALGASLIPARRAASVDPMVSLRGE